MKLLGDKVFIRITNENRESIFKKAIVRDDGSIVKIFINHIADSIDERHSSLFVSTGIVEAVAGSVDHIKVGDIAVIDYTLCNDETKFVSKDDNGELFWANANTSYHKEDLVANQTRRSRRDQIVHQKDELDQISMILGVLRDGVLYANDPYIFLEHISNVSQLVSAGGIHYSKTEKIFDRKVLAISKASSERTGINVGDTVKVNDQDIFLVKYNGVSVDCINDTDCLCIQRESAGLRAV